MMVTPDRWDGSSSILRRGVVGRRIRPDRRWMAASDEDLRSGGLTDGPERFYAERGGAEANRHHWPS